MKQILLGLLIGMSSCAVQSPAVYKKLPDCEYKTDARYVNVALDASNQLYLEDEALDFPDLYPALVELKRIRYQELRKKEQHSKRYFVINFCTHPDADYAKVLRVKGILKQWDTILVR